METITGSVFDKFLEGSNITTIYGPAASGKTNLCMIAALEQLNQNKKVIYIDIGNNFSIERFKQLTDSYEKLLENVVFLKPETFNEQVAIFEKLSKLIDKKINLIVVDSIVVLYRLELDRTKEIYEINKKLGLQVSYLKEIAKKNKIVVLITAQVHDDLKEKDKVNIVSGDILKYGSDCVIELQKLHKNKRKAIIRKHPKIKGEFMFEIRDKGFFPVSDI